MGRLLTGCKKAGQAFGGAEPRERGTAAQLEEREKGLGKLGVVTLGRSRRGSQLGPHSKSCLPGWGFRLSDLKVRGTWALLAVVASVPLRLLFHRLGNQGTESCQLSLILPPLVLLPSPHPHPHPCAFITFAQADPHTHTHTPLSSCQEDGQVALGVRDPRVEWSGDVCLRLNSLP